MDINKKLDKIKQDSSKQHYKITFEQLIDIILELNNISHENNKKINELSQIIEDLQLKVSQNSSLCEDNIEF